jgi:aspartyl-tRNA(Asn)/glutamyl-tRNA(Gln) amidotransferase subunit C
MAKKNISSVPIAHVAKLANLQLTPEQLTKFEQSLNSIVGHMQEVADLDLSKVPSTARVIDEENILREDVVEPSFSQVDALKNAKHTHDGYFMVAHVFENKDA